MSETVNEKISNRRIEKLEMELVIVDVLNYLVFQIIVNKIPDADPGNYSDQ